MALMLGRLLLPIQICAPSHPPARRTIVDPHLQRPLSDTMTPTTEGTGSRDAFTPTNSFRRPSRASLPSFDTFVEANITPGCIITLNTHAITFRLQPTWRRSS